MAADLREALEHISVDLYVNSLMIHRLYWADRLYQYEKLLLAEHLINKVLSLSPYTNAERRFLISQNYSDLMRWYFDLWCYIYGPPAVKS